MGIVQFLYTLPAGFGSIRGKIVSRKLNHMHTMVKSLLQPDYVTKPEFNSFRDEMHVFKNEMYVFKDEMYEFRSEMYDFRDEMYEFRNEVYLRFDDIHDEMVLMRKEIGIDMDMKLERLEMKLTKQMNAHFGAIKELFSHELAKAVEAMSGIIDARMTRHEEKYHSH